MPPAADASFVEAMARTGHADIAAIRPWIKQQGYRGTRDEAPWIGGQGVEHAPTLLAELQQSRRLPLLA
jgi:hypothetical protein